MADRAVTLQAGVDKGREKQHGSGTPVPPATPGPQMRLAHAHDRVPGPAASGSGTPQGAPPGPSGPWREEEGDLAHRPPRGLSVRKLTALLGSASALGFPRSAKLRLKRADKREEVTSGKGGSGFRSVTLIVLHLVDPGYVVPSY